jgi:hypothetical protein
MQNDTEYQHYSFLFVSNFILNAIHHATGAKHELYFKWWFMTKALNGAYIIRDDGVGSEIYFHTPDKKECTDNGSVYFHDMIVTIPIYSKLYTPELAEVVRYAHTEAHQELMTRPQKIYELQRIHFYCLFEATEYNKNKVGDEIAKDFAHIFGAELFNHIGKNFFEELRYDMDFEYLLDPPLTEQEAKIRLKSRIHYAGDLRLQRSADFAVPLVGYGLIVINHDGEDCTDSRLKWAHIIGRHF